MLMRWRLHVASASTRYLSPSTQLAQNRIISAFKICPTSKLLTYPPQMMVTTTVAIRSDLSAPSAGFCGSISLLLSTSTKCRLSISGQSMHARMFGSIWEGHTFQYIMSLGYSGRNSTVNFCCDAVSFVSSARTHGMQRQVATK